MRPPSPSYDERTRGDIENCIKPNDLSSATTTTTMCERTRGDIENCIKPIDLSSATDTTMREQTRGGIEDFTTHDNYTGTSKDQVQLRHRSTKSGVVKKGEIDEDDPFVFDDLPEEYKQYRFSKRTLVRPFSLILIVAGLTCTLTLPYLKHKQLFGLVLWKWGLMLFVLVCGRLVSGWVIRVIVILIERNFVLRKRVLYFVYGLRKAVQNCVWSTLVLIAWHFIFDKKVEHLSKGLHILPYVTKIWICLLVGTFIWLLKTLLVKVLASSFHVSTYFDRIQESLFNQYVIESLCGPPLIEIQQLREEEDRNAGETSPHNLKARRSGRFLKGITIDHLHRLNQKNVSAWNMKRLMSIVRTGVVSTLDEGESGDEDESALQITNEKQAKVAAKRIYNNVAKQGFTRIYLEDLLCFLREVEALKAIRLFDWECETKGFSKEALKIWVVNVFLERRALALSLNDTKTAVNKLHQVLNLVVGILIIVIWLLILKMATTHFFIFLSSQLLLVVFVFGDTCKSTFEAVIFLFVMHPFDVGDRCEIDGKQMIVDKITMLTTVFMRSDNQRVMYPNNVLATKSIGNFSRSPAMGDEVEFSISISTPRDKIDEMRKQIKKYVSNKSEYWFDDPKIVVKAVEEMNTLKMVVWPKHVVNHHHMSQRWERRSELILEMIKVFKDLEIE